MQIEVTSNIEKANGIKAKIEILKELAKVRITGFVTFSSMVGYLLVGNGIDLNFFISAIAVFILASGSAAMNHWQEADMDIGMERTKDRPIPSGRISSNSVLLIAVSAILIGITLLTIGGIMASVVGLVTVIWYNLIYTPLKKVSALAVIPGGVIGSLPPLIGWASAGGSLSDFNILAFALFLFVWQIPHFWLLVLMYGNEYSEAGFPSLTDKFSHFEIAVMTYLWIAILVITSVLFGISDFISNPFSFGLVLLFGVLIMLDSIRIVNNVNKNFYKRSFLNINLYVLAVVMVLTIDRLYIYDLIR